MLSGITGCNPHSEWGKFSKTKDPVSSTNELQNLRDRERETRSGEYVNFEDISTKEHIYVL